MESYTSFTNDINSGTKQAINFTTGQGGTGKSELINAIKEFTLLKFGKTSGTLGPVIVCAPTGNSAYNIGGSTYHKVTGKTAMNKAFKINSKLSTKQTAELRKKGEGAKVLIIDEISLISLECLYA